MEGRFLVAAEGRAAATEITPQLMPAFPPALPDILRLRTGAHAGIPVESGRLLVAPQQRPRRTPDELPAACRPGRARTGKERGWLRSEPAGAGIL